MRVGQVGAERDRALEACTRARRIVKLHPKQPPQVREPRIAGIARACVVEDFQRLGEQPLLAKLEGTSGGPVAGGFGAMAMLVAPPAPAGARIVASGGRGVHVVEGWACLDSNQGPRDYESPALTN